MLFLLGISSEPWLFLSNLRNGLKPIRVDYPIIRTTLELELELELEKDKRGGGRRNQRDI